MKIFKKVFIFIALLLLVFTLTSCNKEKNPGGKEGGDTEIDWSSKRVFQISEIEAYKDLSFEYDEFSLDMVKFLVTYTDGTSREVPLEASMLDDKDLNKLTKAGNPRIYITYEWNGEVFGLNYIVHLVDSALRDLDLNKDGSHGAVVKAIRDLNQNKINFIVEKSEVGIKALQFRYTFDTSIMTLSTISKNSSLAGPAEIKVEGNTITATILLDTMLTEETILFSVDFSGNFRTSKLAVDETFANAVYTVDENLQPVELENVLYHASIK